MNPRETTKIIWRKFHVHPHDNLPFEGWWQSTRETTLYETFADCGFKVGAEVGVRRGTNAIVMFRKIPGLKLYCIDPWVPYLRDTVDKQEGHLAACKRQLAGQNAVFMRMFSTDAAKELEDESLDFVYIDGNHAFDFIMQDLIAWTPKVKKGGIVSGHDYYHFFQGGVVQAVDAYTMGNNISKFYITREKEHSWLFVRE